MLTKCGSGIKQHLNQCSAQKLRHDLRLLGRVHMELEIQILFLLPPLDSSYPTVCSMNSAVKKLKDVCKKHFKKPQIFKRHILYGWRLSWSFEKTLSLVSEKVRFQFFFVFAFFVSLLLTAFNLQSKVGEERVVFKSHFFVMTLPDFWYHWKWITSFLLIFRPKFLYDS